MKPTLLALHGFTLNGSIFRAQMGPLVSALSEHVALEFVDAPHVCPTAAALKLHERWGLPPQAPPHLRWWNASEDGRTYRGWTTSRELLARRLSAPAPVGVLGFSQGAIAAAAVAALSERGELPEIRFVVLIAGRVPRADELAAAFAWPLDVPSLHVWGKKDALTGASAPELADCFAPETREVCVWPGGHTVPTRGPAFAAIVDFVRRHAR